jgi:hypothetical protein
MFLSRGRGKALDPWPQFLRILRQNDLRYFLFLLTALHESPRPLEQFSSILRQSDLKYFNVFCHEVV